MLMGGLTPLINLILAFERFLLQVMRIVKENVVDKKKSVCRDLGCWNQDRCSIHPENNASHLTPIIASRDNKVLYGA